MRMIKFLAKFIASVLAGLFCLYLGIAFIVIPLGVPWVVRSQGAKLLGHEVFLRSARFNPFALRFSVRDFKILDTDKEPMVGFGKFSVDVSFLKLLKKQIYIESVGMDGLALHVVLLPDNQVNLLSLVPAQAAPAVQEKAVPDVEKPQAEPLPAEAVLSLPDIRVESIVLENGVVVFTDKCIAPGFVTRLSGMNLRVDGVSTRPDSMVKIDFQSVIDESGKIDFQAQVKPFVQPLQMEAVFSLNGYALRALTPYAGKYTGRAVKEGGKLDVTVDYRIEDNTLEAGHKVFVQRFDFGEKVESKDVLPLPFGLAVALLEDTQNRINISLPVTGDISDPRFEYFHLLGQVAKNFFMKLVTAPFKALFALVPSGMEGTEELGVVTFAPGVSELPDEQLKKLEVLVTAMKERAQLALEINGCYDPEADWKEIKTQALDTEFAARRQESSSSDMDVYESMYKLKFGVRDFWRLAREYKKDNEGLIREIRRRIIEEGAPDKAALEALGQARADAVHGAMINAGFDPARITAGDVREVKMSMGMISMEFTLVLFGEENVQSAAPAGGEAVPQGE